MNTTSKFNNDLRERALTIMINPDDLSVRWLSEYLEVDNGEDFVFKATMRAYCAILQGVESSVTASLVRDVFRNQSIQSTEIGLVILFGRTCGDDPVVLANCVESMLQAIGEGGLEDTMSEAYCAVAECCVGMGHLEEASIFFHKALPVCRTIDALLGVIICKFKMGSIREAREQFDFVMETQSSALESAELLFVKFLFSNDLVDLNECLNLHIGRFRSENDPINLVTTMNPPFMLDVARQYMGARSYARALNVCETILKYLPRHVPATLALAECYWRTGKNEETKRLLAKINSSTDAVLMHIEILLEDNDAVLAGAMLDELPNRDSNVRLHALFWLLKAKLIFLDTKELRRAIHVLIEGSRCPGGSREVKESISLLLAKAYGEMGDFASAHECVRTSGCIDANVLAVATAELLILEQRFDEAFSELRSVSSDSPIMKKSTELKISIILKHKRGNKNLITAVRETCTGDSSDWERIGDIFLNLGEVDEAITMLEQSPKRDFVKIFEALVLGHRYDEAVHLARTEWRNSSDKNLRARLVQLLSNMRRFDEAVEAAESDSELTQNVFENAYFSTGNLDWVNQAVAALEASLQAPMQRDLKAARLTRLGEWRLRTGQCQLARASFEQAVKLNSTNEGAIIGLSKSHIELGDMEKASQFLEQCAASEPVSALRKRIGAAWKRANEIPGLPIHITQDQIDAISENPSFRIMALYRAGRLSELGSSDPIESVDIAFYTSNIKFLRDLYRSASGTHRVKIATKLVILIVRGCMQKRSCDKHQMEELTELGPFDDSLCRSIISILLVEVSPPNSNDTLVECFLSVLATLVIEKSVSKAKTILKHACQKIVERAVFNESDFWLAESILQLYVEIRLERKEASKAVAEAEFLSSLARGSAKGWKLLGQVYRDVGRYDEAINAFENSLLFHSCVETLEWLAELVYKQKREYFRVLQLITNTELRTKRMTELFEKSIIKLHAL